MPRICERAHHNSRGNNLNPQPEANHQLPTPKPDCCPCLFPALESELGGGTSPPDQRCKNLRLGALSLLYFLCLTKESKGLGLENECKVLHRTVRSEGPRVPSATTQTKILASCLMHATHFRRAPGGAAAWLEVRCPPLRDFSKVSCINSMTLTAANSTWKQNLFAYLFIM